MARNQICSLFLSRLSLPLPLYAELMYETSKIVSYNFTRARVRVCMCQKYLFSLPSSYSIPL